MSLIELLGDTLIQGESEVKTSDVLKDKTVLFYFSAHWCGPCRGFTPSLVKYYETHAKTNNFEIVFLSSDKDDASFKDYFKSMPWLAVPFSKRDVKETISTKLGVRGIPCLCVIDSKGELITKDGRSKVSKDPDCKNFPWTPKPIKELLGNVFKKSKDDVVDATQLNGKTIGLYFSAHWCGPCRTFTPELAKYYKKMKENGKQFEIIFCSGDRDENSFKEYHATMPWLALPYSKRIEKDELSSRFGVRGIPSLVLLDENLKTITTEGRSVVSSDPEGEEFPLMPSVGSLAAPSGIESKKSFVFFYDHLTDEEQKKKIKVSIKQVAMKHREKFGFYVEPTTSSVGPQVKKLTKLPEKTEKVIAICLDLQKGKFYSSDMTEITDKTVTAFVTEMAEGKIVEKDLEKPSR